MITSKCRKLKILNILSLIIYVLVYYAAFYDVEEILVTYYYEEMHHMNKWDEFTMIMFWVGIPFAMELKWYQYQNEMTGRISLLKYMLINIIQLIFIAVSAYMGIANISVMEEFDRRKMTINFFCCILVVLMAVQAVLWLFKTLIYIYEYKRVQNRFKEEIIKEDFDTDHENSTSYKIMMVALKISMGMYLIVNFFEYFNPIVLVLAGVFAAIAVVIPIKLLWKNIIEPLIQSRKYICTATAIILYVIIFNNVYRHLMDRYFYDGNVETIWMNVIIEVVNIIFGVVAIIHIFITYRREMKDESLSGEVTRLNKIREWKYLIMCMVVMRLFVPIRGGLNEDSDYVYKGLWYEFKYINVHEYEEPSEIKGVELKLLGNSVYKLEEIME